MLEDIVLYGIGNIEATFRLDVTSRGTLTERNTIDHVARLRVNQLKFDMLLLPSHHFAGAVVVDIECTKEWFCIARTVRCKAFQIIMQLPRDILEVDEGVKMQ